MIINNFQDYQNTNYIRSLEKNKKNRGTKKYKKENRKIEKQKNRKIDKQ